MDEMNRREIFREKSQPVRDLIAKIKAALDKHPAIYEAERLEELKTARNYARKQYSTRWTKEDEKKAQKALNQLDAQIRQIEMSGPYTPADANIFAAQLSLAIRDAERWAYIIMLNDLLDTFTTLSYWQDLQLEAITTGYSFFNHAEHWPAHWKLSRHAETEVRIMALVDEITKIVMQDGNDMNEELHN